MMVLDTMRAAWRLGTFVLRHPVNRGRSRGAVTRTLRWQLGSRLLGMPAVVDWVDGSRLIVRRGMTGATGNLYTGLHEYADMGFVLHFLRPEELFVDVGANVGSYTVLAAAVCRARCLSIEPVPTTFRYLMDNIRLNGCGDRTEALNIAVGEVEGELQFTSHLDTVNHVLSQSDQARNDCITVPVKRLDDVLAGRAPKLMKIDVEGYEAMVLRGGLASFERTDAVIMELNGSGLRYGIADDAIVALVRAHGFVPAQYDPMSRTLAPVDKLSTEGNTILVRDLAAARERLRAAKSFSVFGAKI